MSMREAETTTGSVLLASEICAIIFENPSCMSQIVPVS